MTETAIPTRWLRDTPALDAWLTGLPENALFAMDTEFERTRTFYPIPGLLQMAAGDTIVLIEPAAATGSALLRQKLASPSCIKLLYAMSEDVDLIRHWLGVDMQGALDLQLGAALAGMGYSVGYAAMVTKLLGVNLAKEVTRSDWISRPLTQVQEQYAADDVRYLLKIYGLIRSALQARGLDDALAEESDRFREDLAAQNDPATYYLRIRGGNRLRPEQQARLAALACWREQQCRLRDRPRGHMIADDVLIELASRRPESLAAMSKIRGLSPAAIKRHGDQLLALLVQEAVPALPAGRITPPLTPALQAQYQQVKTIIESCVESADIPMALFAPRRRLEYWVDNARQAQDLPDFFTNGWRGRLLADKQADLRKALLCPC